MNICKEMKASVPHCIGVTVRTLNHEIFGIHGEK